MTNEELLADLKQFIAATVSQEVSGLRTELKGDIERLDQKIERHDQKLDNIQDAIADALTHASDAADAALHDHEQRLRRLEQRAA